MDRILIIFVAHPNALHTSSRLAQHIDNANQIYESFLRDVLAKTANFGSVERVIAFPPEADEDYFAQIAPTYRRVHQRGASVRERVVNAIHDQLTNEHCQAVLIDADSPHLPVVRLHDAFTLLDTTDLTIGPCDNGDLYLLGLKAPQPALLTGFPAQTSLATRHLTSRAKTLGLSISTLPAWYSIATWADLDRLANDLRTMPPATAPHTQRLFARQLPLEREVGR